MRIENTMSRQMRQLDKFPAGWKIWLQTQIMGRFVPFLKTAGLRFERISHEEVCVSVQNRKKIQNHINGVHACAMALLAETATGFVTNMNTPDDKLILLKAMHINYTRRSVGNMRAVAQINDEQAAMIAQEERGNLVVPCTVYDDSGEQPVEVEMTWAWVPKQKKEEAAKATEAAA